MTIATSKCYETEYEEDGSVARIVEYRTFTHAFGKVEPEPEKNADERALEAFEAALKAWRLS